MDSNRNMNDNNNGNINNNNHPVAFLDGLVWLLERPSEREIERGIEREKEREGERELDALSRAFQRQRGLTLGEK